MEDFPHHQFDDASVEGREFSGSSSDDWHGLPSRVTVGLQNIDIMCL